MSKKRKRDLDESSLSLVDVYNNLSDENAAIRSEAAQALLTKFSDASTTSPDQISTAAKRLLRGLCSGRKAARPGFAVVLTEFLAQVFAFPEAARSISANQIVDLLHSLTAPSESVSRQDEREHYFGRVFGAEAVLRSGILFDPASEQALRRLIGLICTVATKKPWLRQQCGLVLYKSITKRNTSAAGLILEILHEHKLIRSPEGVAIWLAVQQEVPDAKFPKDVWKHDNPLHKKETVLLAKVMRDATPKNDEEVEPKQSQGSAIWQARLHFAWIPVLRKLFSNIDDSGQPKSSKLLPFERFWSEVIDESFFASSSSSERKHTGFLVCCEVINGEQSQAPASLLPVILKGKFMRTLINQLASGERLLHRASQKVVQALNLRARESASASIAIVDALLNGSDGSGTFDQVTKTNTVEKLVNNLQVAVVEEVVNDVVKFVAKPGAVVGSQAHAKRQGAADLLVSMFCRSLAGDVDKDTGRLVQSKILTALVKFAFFIPDKQTEAKPPDWPSEVLSTRQMMQARLSTCLERAMKVQSTDNTSLDTTVAEIRRLEKAPQKWKSAIEMDAGVRNALETAWVALETVRGQSVRSSPYLDALKLLFLLSILQVYNGEPDAVQILEELGEYAGSAAGSKPEENADGIIEILLSFSAKPSKFLRRITLQVFQSSASWVTSSGLSSLTRIIEADESAKGQQELFDVDASGEELGENDASGDDSDEYSNEDDDSSLGSDVEMVEAENAGSIASPSSSGSEQDPDGSGEEEDGDDGDDELAEFDRKLAAALGTREGEDDLDASDTSGSDEDMGDDEMEALDEKLVSHFKARKDMMNKKKENKDAKGNIVQFKNRVLDLVEVYLKQEYLNPLSLELVLPLLMATRTSRTKQISDRSCLVLREFFSRCKGKNVPGLRDLPFAVDMLKLIHHEAALESSGAHAAACSQASLLFVKVLVAQSPDNVRMAVNAYADMRKRQLTDKSCHVHTSFFTDWNNWCQSVSQQLRK